MPYGSQAKDERAKYFRILSILAGHNQDELKALDDGGRDPRNLICLFEYMPTFLQHYPLLHLGEEMFEIFCLLLSD